MQASTYLRLYDEQRYQCAKPPTNNQMNNWKPSPIEYFQCSRHTRRPCRRIYTDGRDIYIRIVENVICCNVASIEFGAKVEQATNMHAQKKQFVSIRMRMV